MAQQLIVDIGNSSAKVALFEGDTLVEDFRIEHEALARFFAGKATDTAIRAAIVSTVIPLGDEVEQAIGALPTPACACRHS